MTEVKMPASPATQGKAPAENVNVESAAKQQAAPLPANAAAQTQSAQAAMAKEMLIEILFNAGFKATEENLAMLKLLTDNGIPLTRENILRMNQALKLTHESAAAGTPDKALFMLMNQMRLSTANAAQLEGLANGAVRIGDMLNNLLQAIRQIDDPVLAAQLMRVLTNTQQNVQNSGAPAQTADGQQPAQPGTVPADGQQPAPTTAAPQGEQTPAPAVPQTGGGQQTAQPTQPDIAQNPAAPQDGQAVQAGATQTAEGQQPAQLLQAQSADGQPTAQPAAPGATQTAEGQQPAQNAQPAEAGTPQTDNPQSTQTNTQPTTTQLAQPAPAQTAAARPAQSDGTPSPAPNNTAPNAPTQQHPLTYRPLNSTPQDIDRFFNTLRENLNHIRQLLSDNPTPAAARVVREARSLNNHIDFTAQIRNQLYVQLPLHHNGHDTQTALHIYRDTKKVADGKKDTASALIALDTASLGRFETYVQKNGASVHCQFRLDTPQIEAKVRDNIHQLEALLRHYNYSLSSFSFAAPGKPYTLLDSPALFDEDFTIESTEAHLPRFDKKA